MVRILLYMLHIYNLYLHNICCSKSDSKITFLTFFLARPVFTSTSFDDSRRRFFDFERRRKNFWNHFEFGCWRKRICQCLGVARLDVVSKEEGTSTRCWRSSEFFIFDDVVVVFVVIVVLLVFVGRRFCYCYHCYSSCWYKCICQQGKSNWIK